MHQSFSDFSYLMPGYVGRRFALQGELDPTHTGEAILEITVSYLRKCFEGTSPLEQLRTIAQRYSHFVLEGTDLRLDEAAAEAGSAAPAHPTDDAVPAPPDGQPEP